MPDPGLKQKYLLSIRDLDVSFELSIQRGNFAHEPRANLGRAAHALRGIDLNMSWGEVHALVGESGSGKTVASTCIMGLVPIPPGKINRGALIFKGRDLLSLSQAERRKVRGREIAMIFQEPAKYLNPALKVGEQITEMLRLHMGMEKKEAFKRALELAELVGLKGGSNILHSYPHELSGGMKQRAMIAMAISCNPSLLIADEPTTALDVTLQLQILKLMLRLRARFSMGILFVSHDLGVVHDISDKISVIYAGMIVESASKHSLFKNPLHPYTQLLLLSIPDADRRGTRLSVIPGTIPDAEHIPQGCAFHTRCPIAEEICRIKIPETIEYENGADARSSNSLAHTAACHMIGKKWLDR